MIRTLTATEYITPLREGGSLPAVVKADDDQLYVMKFRGSGQGEKALIAELIAGEIGRHLGFLIPEIVFMELDPLIGKNEPDAEIQDLLHFSTGLNLGMRFLKQASAFNLLLDPKPSAQFASEVVWFDAFVTNVDRTPRNVNILMQKQKIWLIDHGAALFFHHNPKDPVKQSLNPFPAIIDHVLLPLAENLDQIDQQMKEKLSPDTIKKIVSIIPQEWLNENNSGKVRDIYIEFLLNRLNKSDIFLKEAQSARAKLL